MTKVFRNLLEGIQSIFDILKIVLEIPQEQPLQIINYLCFSIVHTK